MADTQRVIRTNISLPRELKARMDAVKRTVNWSAVAAEAFKAKLLEIQSKRDVEHMDEVIARLKAAEEMDASESYREGHRAGSEWAKRRARPKHLRGLAKLADESQGVLAGHLELFGNDMNRGIAWGLYLAMHQHEEFQRPDVEGFWQQILGDSGAERIEAYNFALGFVEGALDIWNKVENDMG
jgi:hypothetical protein